MATARRKAPVPGKTPPKQQDPLIFTGPPSRLSADLTVANTGDRRLAVRGVTIVREGSVDLDVQAAALVPPLLHARAGEERVIPFLLRNPWRREREVAVAVGAWHVCEGGRLEVRSEVDAGESLTLQPCENRVVRLGVRVRGICYDTTNTKDDTKGDPKSGPMDERRFGCDVESCASAYADVRFEGCARPQRVAVV